MIGEFEKKFDNKGYKVKMIEADMFEEMEEVEEENDDNWVGFK